jgi:hypothetical protein
MMKSALERMLESEIDAHLGRKKLSVSTARERVANRGRSRR